MKDLHLYIEEAINGYRLTFWDGERISYKVNSETYIEVLREGKLLLEKEILKAYEALGYIQR
jgi:hypothetical protein